jgi:hypothetical protein
MSIGPEWYFRFHGLRHPMDMGATEVQAFLAAVVVWCHR